MKFFSFLTLFIFIIACNDSKTTAKDSSISEEKQAPIVESSEFDALMEKIDADLPDLSRVESLIYHKEDGSSISVIAYLDQNDLITKIEEERVDGNNNSGSKFHYYSNGGILFATKKASEKVKDNSAYFSEEISFYAPDGNVTKSKERTANFEEYIDQENFKEIKPTKHENTNALQVLTQKGSYSTTFQGFVESGPYHFLIVGENVSSNGYSASLSIQEDSPTLRYLRKEGRKALGKELEVQFEKYVDGQGYIMQILKNVSLVERK